MEYTVTVTQTAGGAGEYRIRCLEWHGSVATRVPITWKRQGGARVGTIQLTAGVRYGIACGLWGAGVKLTVNLDPPTPVYDPEGTPWPAEVSETLELNFRAGA